MSATIIIARLASRFFPLDQLWGLTSSVRSDELAWRVVWIWDLVDELFSLTVQIVDWYHTVQHFHRAAQTLYPTDELAQQKWLKPMKNSLYDGNLSLIIQTLRASPQPQLAHYFERHQARMTYVNFRQPGLPLGSGSVESGVKQFKQRLAGPGMRWNLDNTQRMIVICATVLDDSFDVLYAVACFCQKDEMHPGKVRLELTLWKSC